MKIYLASDHGGWFLKEELQKYLEGKGHDVEDMGNLEYEKEDDYPDFVIPLAEKVALRQAQRKPGLGIILGRSGNGEAIAANKVKGVRASLCMTEKMAQKARLDNDANILSLPADYINLETAKVIVDTFIKTSFSGKLKHKRRIKKITAYESPNN